MRMEEIGGYFQGGFPEVMKMMLQMHLYQEVAHVRVATPLGECKRAGPGANFEVGEAVHCIYLGGPLAVCWSSALSSGLLDDE